MDNLEFSPLKTFQFEKESLSKIEILYQKKLKLLEQLLKEFNENIGNENFDFNDHYQNFYSKRFASIGGEISGVVRFQKNILIMEILSFLKLKFKDETKFLTLKMYENFSRFLFKSAPSNKDLKVFLDIDMSLNQKLRMKKEILGHHISKMNFNDILGDNETKKYQEIFNKIYDDFLKKRMALRIEILPLETEIKAILKENKKDDD